MRNFIKTIALLILAYLVLIHATSFSKDVSTVFGGGTHLVATLQGRG